MKNKKDFESSLILKKAFQSLKLNDSFSLRQWSQIVGISATNLNFILNSKRLLPVKHIKQIALSLGLDELAQDNLRKARSRDWRQIKGIEVTSPLDMGEPSEDTVIENIIIDEKILLKSWLHLAVLEFTACEDFKDDHKYLAERFGVSASEIKSVLHELEVSGHLMRNNQGKIFKRNQKMRIPTQRSRSVIRAFHKQNLQKAMKHLDHFQDFESFEKRLITSYTVAVNPAHIHQIKLFLERSLIEASIKLCEGECKEVYQLQLQLFPLSIKKKST